MKTKCMKINLFAALLWAWSQSVAALDEIRVGYFYEWPAPALVAQAKNLFEQALGIPVHWIAYETSYDFNRALHNGEIQIAFSHEIIPFMEGVAAGLDAFITGIAVTYPDYDLCVAHEESAINVDDPHSFSGKTIATMKGTISHLRAIKTMEILGVDPQSINYTYRGYGASVAKALHRHHADIGCAYGGPLRVMYRVGEAIIDGIQLEKYGIKLFDVISMSGSFVKHHKLLAKKFMRVVDSQNRQYLETPDAMKKDLSDTSNLKIVITHRLLKLLNFLTVEQQLSQDWLGHHGDVVRYMNNLGQFLSNHDKLSHALTDYSRVIDTSLLE